MLICVILFLLPTSISAGQCAPYEVLKKRLGDKYGEVVHGLGLTSNGNKATQLYISDKTGTWTIVVTDTKKRSCIIVFGTSWEKMEGVLAIPEDDL